MNFKKSISPVVAVALLLVVAVLAVVFFNQWFNQYLSDTFVNTEQSGLGDNSYTVNINDLIGNTLYVRSTYIDNVSIKSLAIEDNVCNITNQSNLSINMNKLDVSDCLVNLSSRVSVVLVTEDQVLSKEFFIAGSKSLGSQSEQEEETGGSSVSGYFLTKWNTSMPGNTSSEQIRLPLHSDGTYNFNVSWGDGTNSTITAYDDPDITHTYPSPGMYIVNITGQIEGFGFKECNDIMDYEDDEKDDEDKLRNILNWGQVKISNNGFVFADCDYLQISADDTPDLSGINNLTGMFIYASGFNSNINDWNVSNIVDMTATFGQWGQPGIFNQPLNNWDVSNVKSMKYMFQGTYFNQSINNWNTSNVEDMAYMFFINLFNKPLNNWNTSNVVDMQGMFQSSQFNQNISMWDVDQVTNCADFNTDCNLNISYYPNFVSCSFS